MKTVNTIKTAKGFNFNVVNGTDGKLFQLSDNGDYATVSKHSEYMIDAGTQEPMMWAGKITESY